jgi:hypothetical protein
MIFVISRDFEDAIMSPMAAAHIAPVIRNISPPRITVTKVGHAAAPNANLK